MRRKGFTLIELLIVIAIIAILAAIAIPQFARYRIRAYNSAAESDLRNAKTDFEAFFADWQSYPDANMNANTGAIEVTFSVLGTGVVDTIRTSNAVSIQWNVSTGAIGNRNYRDSYVMASKHIQGDTKYGTDSDGSVIYFARSSTLIGQNVAQAAPNLPTPTPRVDNFIGQTGWIPQ